MAWYVEARQKIPLQDTNKVLRSVSVPAIILAMSVPAPFGVGNRSIIDSLMLLSLSLSDIRKPRYR
jgi:hypothetical protein